MQRGVENNDYEIILIDNGSSTPLKLEDFPQVDVALTLVRIENASVSPAAAINRGLELAKGNLIGVWIDGARLASPGIISTALRASKLHSRPVIATVGYHLGEQMQFYSVKEGYDQAAEDALLLNARWTEDGYRLFDICAFAGSSSGGWFQPFAETNALFLSKEMWTELGGYDLGFQMPGGGLVNLDTYVRACELKDSQLIILLGEGTFHQVHGGVATNGPTVRWPQTHAEYVKLRGRPFVSPANSPWYFGSLPPQTLKWLARSVALAEKKPAK
jgi:hypothetical protein